MEESTMLDAIQFTNTFAKFGLQRLIAFDRRLITCWLIVFSLLLGGCTSMQTVNQAKAEWQDKIELGDKVVVYEHSGKIQPLTVQIITDDGFGGVGPGGYQDIAWNDIVKIEREQIDPLKTTGAVIGTAILVPIAVVLCLAGGCQ